MEPALGGCGRAWLSGSVVCHEMLLLRDRAQGLESTPAARLVAKTASGGAVGGLSSGRRVAALLEPAASSGGREAGALLLRRRDLRIQIAEVGDGRVADAEDLLERRVDQLRRSLLVLEGLGGRRGSPPPTPPWPT